MLKCMSLVFFWIILSSLNTIYKPLYIFFQKRYCTKVFQERMFSVQLLVEACICIRWRGILILFWQVSCHFPPYGHIYDNVSMSVFCSLDLASFSFDIVLPEVGFVDEVSRKNSIGLTTYISPKLYYPKLALTSDISNKKVKTRFCHGLVTNVFFITIGAWSLVLYEPTSYIWW